VVAVKALACELPSRLGIPVSRFSREDLKRLVVEQGIVASISGITIWRWLSKDAIKPWQYRSWLFPRDPEFASKAGPLLDLYQKEWMGMPLEPTDYVISTDEKTSIQARKRKAETLPPKSGSSREHSPAEITSGEDLQAHSNPKPLNALPERPSGSMTEQVRNADAKKPVGVSLRLSMRKGTNGRRWNPAPGIFQMVSSPVDGLTCAGLRKHGNGFRICSWRPARQSTALQ